MVFVPPDLLQGVLCCVCLSSPVWRPLYEDTGDPDFCWQCRMCEKLKTHSHDGNIDMLDGEHSLRRKMSSRR